MRKTKIVCTLGPAVDDYKVLAKLCASGMNVARFNFSHGDYEQQGKRIEVFKAVRSELNLYIPMMLDTKGPEIRIGTFKNKVAALIDGEEFTLAHDECEGDSHRVYVNYPLLSSDVNVGTRILINDGLIELEVIEIIDKDVKCKIIHGGNLTDRKSVNIPGLVLNLPLLTKKDEEDIIFGIENGFDIIAASFVRKPEDILAIREILKKYHAEHIKIIAKIENHEGVENFDKILDVVDGIMVARGDMGVEIPFEQLPSIQKKLITKCRMLGTRVITATEMLESMIHNSRPTRAEISDVANAVYDGTSAIMLSGETAAGRYPVRSVENMAKIAEATENNTNYKKRFRVSEFRIKNTVDAISHATCGMAIDIDAKAIVACSLSGMTARMVSRFRSPVPIIGLTTDAGTWRRLSLSWGVIPAMCERFTSTEVLFYTAKKIAEQTLRLEKDDKIVITGGVTTGESGNTNLIKIESI